MLSSPYSEFWKAIRMYLFSRPSIDNSWRVLFERIPYHWRKFPNNWKYNTGKLSILKCTEMRKLIKHSRASSNATAQPRQAVEICLLFISKLFRINKVPAQRVMNSHTTTPNHNFAHILHKKSEKKEVLSHLVIKIWCQHQVRPSTAIGGQIHSPFVNQILSYAFSIPWLPRHGDTRDREGVTGVLAKPPVQLLFPTGVWPVNCSSLLQTNAGSNLLLRQITRKQQTSACLPASISARLWCYNWLASAREMYF